MNYPAAELRGILLIKIPNNLTANTLKKSENGKELHSISNIDELFQELNS